MKEKMEQISSVNNVDLNAVLNAILLNILHVTVLV